MRRGQRKLWREVAVAATKVAESKNVAEEYMAGIEFTRAMDSLLASAAPDASTALASRGGAASGEGEQA